VFCWHVHTSTSRVIFFILLYYKAIFLWFYFRVRWIFGANKQAAGILAAYCRQQASVDKGVRLRCRQCAPHRGRTRSQSGRIPTHGNSHSALIKLYTICIYWVESAAALSIGIISNGTRVIGNLSICASWCM